jgi:adenylate kinase
LRAAVVCFKVAALRGKAKKLSHRRLFMYLILLGAPGAGKGTVAKKLLSAVKAAHISTGDILRGAVAAGTDLGKQAKAFMDAGKLVPDDLILGIMKERLKEADAKAGFILDGFPRTIPQADGLAKILADLGVKLTGVINIDVPEAVILDRILTRRTCSNPQCQAIYNVKYMPPKVEGICDKCGSKLIVREDETEEVVRNRLRVYDQNTAPLIQYYQKKGQLHSFPGESSQVIFDGVMKLLGR